MVVGVFLVIVAVVLAILFPKIVDALVDREVALQEGGRAYGWWKAPPVVPRMDIYIYNVTNADEFLNNGEKPALQELGPYVYVERWEKVEIKFNGNDTLTYKQRKEFVFAPVSFSTDPSFFFLCSLNFFLGRLFVHIAI